MKLNKTAAVLGHLSTRIFSKSVLEQASVYLPSIFLTAHLSTYQASFSLHTCLPTKHPVIFENEIVCFVGKNGERGRQFLEDYTIQRGQVGRAGWGVLVVGKGWGHVGVGWMGMIAVRSCGMGRKSCVDG